MTRTLTILGLLTALLFAGSAGAADISREQAISDYQQILGIINAGSLKIAGPHAQHHRLLEKRFLDAARANRDHPTKASKAALQRLQAQGAANEQSDVDFQIESFSVPYLPRLRAATLTLIHTVGNDLQAHLSGMSQPELQKFFFSDNHPSPAVQFILDQPGYAAVLKNAASRQVYWREDWQDFVDESGQPDLEIYPIVLRPADALTHNPYQINLTTVQVEPPQIVGFIVTFRLRGGKFQYATRWVGDHAELLNFSHQNGGGEWDGGDPTTFLLGWWKEKPQIRAPYITAEKAFWKSAPGQALDYDQLIIRPIDDPNAQVAFLKSMLLAGPLTPDQISEDKLNGQIRLAVPVKAINGKDASTAYLETSGYGVQSESGILSIEGYARSTPFRFQIRYDKKTKSGTLTYDAR